MAAVIDEEEFTACGLCKDACPQEAITVDDVARVNPELCTECGETVWTPHDYLVGWVFVRQPDVHRQAGSHQVSDVTGLATTMCKTRTTAPAVSWFKKRADK